MSEKMFLVTDSMHNIHRFSRVKGNTVLKTREDALIYMGRLLDNLDQKGRCENLGGFFGLELLEVDTSFEPHSVDAYVVHLSVYRLNPSEETEQQFRVFSDFDLAKAFLQERANPFLEQGGVREEVRFYQDAFKIRQEIEETSEVNVEFVGTILNGKVFSPRREA